jgi:hypothetical protein
MSGFSGLWNSFPIIKRFSDDFLFKIQILNKNSKSADFPIYQLIFPIFIFQNFQKI